MLAPSPIPEENFTEAETVRPMSTNVRYPYQVNMDDDTPSLGSIRESLTPGDNGCEAKRREACGASE